MVYQYRTEDFQNLLKIFAVFCYAIKTNTAIRSRVSQRSRHEWTASWSQHDTRTV